jgi:fucose 4-O-acetylase-like acetyltransferase
MPLFTAISGFVYALKPVTGDVFGKFLKGKSRRILLPMVFVGSLQYIMNAITPNVNQPVPLEEIWKIYVFPYGQFWFLQALFLVFIVITILESSKALSTLKGWAIIFGIATLVLIFAEPRLPFNFFSFNRFLYLFPFFLLGLGINRFSEKLFTKQNILILLVIFVSGITVQQLKWFGVLNFSTVGFNPLRVIVGITGIWLIFHIRKPNKWLAELGYYSYGIYLFHVLGTAGLRIFAKAVGLESLPMTFILGLAFGLGLPILLELVLLKSAILRRLFLGLK